MIALPVWDLSEARGPGNWTPNTGGFVGTLSLDEPILETQRHVSTALGFGSV